MPESSEWISLGEAAAILGVHPATLRHWADSGELPSQRTPGGHRRFRRRDLEQWANLRNQQVDPKAARLAMQSALGRARIEVSTGQLEDQSWYQQLDKQAHEEHRALGRRLLELLTAYLAEPDRREELLEMTRQLGEEYARLSLDQNLSLTDSIRAFLFFRDLVIDSIIQLAELLSLRTPLEWGDRLRQVNQLTDEILLALVDAYQ